MVEFCGGVLPSSEAEFATVAYWDRFYAAQRGENFEWYVDAARCAAVCSHFVGDGEDFVLNLGCGTCGFPFELALLKPEAEILSVDYSAGAVDALQKRADGQANLTFAVDDAFALTTVPRPAHLAFDKGLVDALHCRDDDANRDSITKLVASVESNLLPAGALLVVSLLQPHVRRLLQHALAPWWRCAVAPLGGVGKFVPFVVFASQAAGEAGVFWADDATELAGGGNAMGWDDLWARVDGAVAAAAVEDAPKKKRKLVAIELQIKLRGRCVDKRAAELLLAKVQELDASKALPAGFLSWRDAPSVKPLAYGVHYVHCTSLNDADLNDTEAFGAALGDALGAVAEDEEATSSDGEDENAPIELRVALPEIASLVWGEEA
ncbi:hypothetical protein M885DRAFT_510075 [Pelagophyceae sp. CCMP2097]|nr:hypothetical protein M885DRAFT_510075 [Pelagophyceae sp. CCMP2097]|mmetsp:Transcript_4243/g.14948  ORF Transcript_4243/g.14948 Transcript_4243/m.14948 type:complete len:379 (-) Transcript_4243:43-1179(-)